MTVYFKVHYNIGLINTGTFYVQARTKKEAKRKAKERDLYFLAEPMRIRKEDYEAVVFRLGGERL